MKKRLSAIILVLIFFIGVSLIIYPTAANYWNRRTQSRVISRYEETLQSMDRMDFSDVFAAADEYNLKLAELTEPFSTFDEVAGYEDLLNVGGSGVMGYITIDKINVELPIYHGTSAEVLNSAAGHLEGSSLPAGGPGTHSVFSAHRGLPSAKLFTHLDKLEEGDVFTLTILNRVLTYEVDRIRIVLPHEIEGLLPVEGKDYCTLFTCTPYGINTHRLMIRGVRIETAAPKPLIYVANEAYRINPVIVTPVIAVPMLLVLLIILLAKYRTRGKRR
ncbi:MAG: class C sortase [Lachnospiraceae bacterium]